MRISVERGSRGFAAWQRIADAGGRVLVLLDGVQQRHCLMVDEKSGEVKRLVTDERGHVVEDGETGDAETELVTGKVEITVLGLPQA